MPTLKDCRHKSNLAQTSEDLPLLKLIYRRRRRLALNNLNGRPALLRSTGRPGRKSDMPTLQHELEKLKRPTMPFGLHKGKPLDDLPDDYLLWLSCLDDLRQPLLGRILAEMGRRLSERPAAEIAVAI